MDCYLHNYQESDPEGSRKSMSSDHLDEVSSQRSQSPSTSNPYAGIFKGMYLPYDFSPNCTNCFALGCELRSSKIVIFELSKKLCSNKAEIKQCMEELYSLKIKVAKLEAKLRKLRGSYDYEDLEQHLNTLKENNDGKDLHKEPHELRENRYLDEQVDSLKKNCDHKDLHYELTTLGESYDQKNSDKELILFSKSHHQILFEKESNNLRGYHHGLDAEKEKMFRGNNDLEDSCPELSNLGENSDLKDSANTKTEEHVDVSSFTYQDSTRSSPFSSSDPCSDCLTVPLEESSSKQRSSDPARQSLGPSRNSSNWRSSSIGKQCHRDSQSSKYQHPNVDPQSKSSTHSPRSYGYVPEMQQRGFAKYQHDGKMGKNPQTSNNVQKGILKEIKSDLFNMPPEFSLAHCVGSDFIMSSGIAVNFRKNYRHVPELLDQKKSPGQVAFLQGPEKGQYIYYLVTKMCSTGKPKWQDFMRSIKAWKELCLEHNVKKIAIPKIGCGRDMLDWNEVQSLLNSVFSDTGIEIVVCVIDQEPLPEKKWNLKLVHHKNEPLADLDPRDCALVFIASKDRKLTKSICRLATKFGFVSDYSSHRLGLGSLYTYRNKALHANVFGLVAKELHDDPLSFVTISKCLQDLKRVVQKSSLWYMGFEAFDDSQCQMATRKIWTLIIDVFFKDNIEVHFCWPEEVLEKCWEAQVAKP